MRCASRVGVGRGRAGGGPERSSSPRWPCHALSAAGCGYALAGRGSFLPAYITVIGIPQFTNATPYEVIDQVFTERVRSEFIGRGKYRVLPQSTGVDAVLSG